MLQKGGVKSFIELQIMQLNQYAEKYINIMTEGLTTLLLRYFKCRL